MEPARQHTLAMGARARDIRRGLRSPPAGAPDGSVCGCSLGPTYLNQAPPQQSRGQGRPNGRPIAAWPGAPLVSAAPSRARLCSRQVTPQARMPDFNRHLSRLLENAREHDVGEQQPQQPREHHVIRHGYDRAPDQQPFPAHQPHCRARRHDVVNRDHVAGGSAKRL